MTLNSIRTLFLVCLAIFSITAVAAEHQAVKLTWAGCGVTKKAFMGELAKAYEKKTGIKINLEGGGATRGIREAAANHVDIGGSCRLTLPSEAGIEFHASLYPVAWDALTVITNPANPIASITSEQLRSIYLGKITNWRELGGNDAPIHLYIRQGKISGVGYAVRQYLFKDSTVDFVTKPEFIKRSTGPIEEAVESDPLSIGITGVSSARKRKVKLTGLDGMIPSYENVKLGKYTMYRPLYMVTPPSPSKAARDFIAFATSHEGRDVLRNSGTVPYLDAPNLMNKMVIYGFDVR